MMVGILVMTNAKPAESATSPGTCLPVDKGGTGCDTLPVALGGTGGTTPLSARAGLGFATLGAAQTITTDMTNLQSTIDSLPKFLANNVTINVTAGEVASDINIERFTGMGNLMIRAVDGGGTPIGTAGQQNHKADRFLVQNNTLPMIGLNGMTSTSGNDSSFYIFRNTAAIVLNYNSAVSGANSTTGNIGLYVYANKGYVNSETGNTISNQYRAIWAAYGNVGVANYAGTDNATVYFSNQGSIIQIMTAGTITGTTMYGRAYGGVIFDVNGNQRGNAAEVQNFTVNGVTFNLYRKGSTIEIHSGTDFTSATTVNQVLFTAPVGMRPVHNTQLQMRSIAGTSFRFLFNTDGTFLSVGVIPAGTQMRDAVMVTAAD